MNRPLISSLAAVLVAGGIATTVTAVEPSMRPAAGRIVVDGRPAVLVFPFAPVGDAAARRAGEAIREGVAAGLGRDGAVHIVEAPAAVPTRPADVAAGQQAATDALLGAARDAGADVAVWGTYEVAGDEIRITGRVVDVRRGDLLGTLKASGPLREVFRVEDGIADQARRLVRGPGADPVRGGGPVVVRPAPAAAPYPPSYVPSTYVTGPRFYPYDPSFDPSYTYGPAYPRRYVPYTYGYGYSSRPRYYVAPRARREYGTTPHSAPGSGHSGGVGAHVGTQARPHVSGSGGHSGGSGGHWGASRSVARGISRR